MKILISIDDTDDIESRGTGEIADLLAAGIVTNSWGTCGPVTRHQLLLHPDIPYTSHNSSMCFPAEISGEMLGAVTHYCATALAVESVPDSDPGLCVLVPEQLVHPEHLISYGYRTKTDVISKDEAYATAAVHGIHLSEHGGSGQGVIGALAGAALRLTGNDGRFKGKFCVPSRKGMATVGEICRSGIDAVQTRFGVALNNNDVVQVGEWVKPVLKNEQAVLLVVAGDGAAGTVWQACDRKIFKDY